MIDDRPILALDLASTTGWARWTPDTGYEWGHIDLPPHSRDPVRFFRAAAEAIEELPRPELLVIERPSSRYWAASCVAYGLRAVACQAADYWAAAFLEVTATEVKTIATGKGRAAKEEVAAAAAKRWGHIVTFDEADALWALEFARVYAEVEP